MADGAGHAYSVPNPGVGLSFDSVPATPAPQYDSSMSMSGNYSIPPASDADGRSYGGQSRSPSRSNEEPSSYVPPFQGSQFNTLSGYVANTSPAYTPSSAASVYSSMASQNTRPVQGQTLGSGGVTSAASYEPPSSVGQTVSDEAAMVARFGQDQIAVNSKEGGPSSLAADYQYSGHYAQSPQHMNAMQSHQMYHSPSRHPGVPTNPSAMTNYNSLPVGGPSIGARYPHMAGSNYPAPPQPMGPYGGGPSPHLGPMMSYGSSMLPPSASSPQAPPDTSQSSRFPPTNYGQPGANGKARPAPTNPGPPSQMHRMPYGSAAAGMPLDNRLGHSMGGQPAVGAANYRYGFPPASHGMPPYALPQSGTEYNMSPWPSQHHMPHVQPVQNSNQMADKGYGQGHMRLDPSMGYESFTGRQNFKSPPMDSHAMFSGHQKQHKEASGIADDQVKSGAQQNIPTSAANESGTAKPKRSRSSNPSSKRSNNKNATDSAGSSGIATQQSTSSMLPAAQARPIIPRGGVHGMAGPRPMPYPTQGGMTMRHSYPMNMPGAAQQHRPQARESVPSISPVGGYGAPSSDPYSMAMMSQGQKNFYMDYSQPRVSPVDVGQTSPSGQPTQMENSGYKSQTSAGQPSFHRPEMELQQQQQQQQHQPQQHVNSSMMPMPHHQPPHHASRFYGPPMGANCSPQYMPFQPFDPLRGPSPGVGMSIGQPMPQTDPSSRNNIRPGHNGTLSAAPRSNFDPDDLGQARSNAASFADPNSLKRLEQMVMPPPQQQAAVHPMCHSPRPTGMNAADMLVTPTTSAEDVDSHDRLSTPKTAAVYTAPSPVQAEHIVSPQRTPMPPNMSQSSEEQAATPTGGEVVAQSPCNRSQNPSTPTPTSTAHSVVNESLNPNGGMSGSDKRSADDLLESKQVTVSQKSVCSDIDGGEAVVSSCSDTPPSTESQVNQAECRIVPSQSGTEDEHNITSTTNHVAEESVNIDFLDSFCASTTGSGSAVTATAPGATASTPRSISDLPDGEQRVSSSKEDGDDMCGDDKEEEPSSTTNGCSPLMMQPDEVDVPLLAASRTPEPVQVAPHPSNSSLVLTACEGTVSDVDKVSPEPERKLKEEADSSCCVESAAEETPVDKIDSEPKPVKDEENVPSESQEDLPADGEQKVDLVDKITNSPSAADVEEGGVRDGEEQVESGPVAAEERCDNASWPAADEGGTDRTVTPPTGQLELRPPIPFDSRGVHPTQFGAMARPPFPYQHPGPAYYRGMGPAPYFQPQPIGPYPRGGPSMGDVSPFIPPPDYFQPQQGFRQHMPVRFDQSQPDVSAVSHQPQMATTSSSQPSPSPATPHAIEDKITSQPDREGQLLERSSASDAVVDVDGEQQSSSLCKKPTTPSRKGRPPGSRNKRSPTTPSSTGATEQAKKSTNKKKRPRQLSADQQTESHLTDDVQVEEEPSLDSVISQEDSVDKSGGSSVSVADIVPETSIESTAITPPVQPVVKKAKSNFQRKNMKTNKKNAISKTVLLFAKNANKNKKRKRMSATDLDRDSSMVDEPDELGSDVDPNEALLADDDESDSDAELEIVSKRSRATLIRKRMELKMAKVKKNCGASSSSTQSHSAGQNSAHAMAIGRDVDISDPFGGDSEIGGDHPLNKSGEFDAMDVNSTARRSSRNVNRARKTYNDDFNLSQLEDDSLNVSATIDVADLSHDGSVDLKSEQDAKHTTSEIQPAAGAQKTKQSISKTSSTSGPNFTFVDPSAADNMIIQLILASRMADREVVNEESKVEPSSEAKLEDSPNEGKVVESSESKDGETIDTEKKLDDGEQQGEDANVGDKKQVVQVEEFFVKFRNFSYLHCQWLTEEELLRGDKRAGAKIKRYKVKKIYSPANEFYGEDEPFNPDFVEIDRILDIAETATVDDPTEAEVDTSSTVEDASHADAKVTDEADPVDSSIEDQTADPKSEDQKLAVPAAAVEERLAKHTKQYLVKWRSLPYEESTWEFEVDVDPIKIKTFETFSNVPPQSTWHMIRRRPRAGEWKKYDETPTFSNGNSLRPYQLEGLNWLLFSWHHGRNCLLADEMGLGKTIQSLTFLECVSREAQIHGPFLVIVPLSTIAHWQREFETWTEMNVIVYHGSQTSRNMIAEYEFYHRDPKSGRRLTEPPVYKFNVLITTYECVITDILQLSAVSWRICVIDEAHRLKNAKCKLFEGLQLLHIESRLLLSGTPLQNNITELFSLLSFLEPSQFSGNLDSFLRDFGDMQNEEQVNRLQTLLKPLMLRRMKNDVEKSLKPKEETIVEVELTNIQKKYYRAILERNFSFLKNSSNANLPSLMNTMMELRKCCIHPFLLKGAEEQIQADYSSRPQMAGGMESDATDPDKLYFHSLINSSGKMVLLDKLLPRLKKDGHRVLIFSQMVRMLDVLEEYLARSEYHYERIDGRIRGDLRQAAIDRFCRPDSDRFVFLLCTKAGGLGINLVAADTCIIYDSDWNPQNDLQAQARCHRIGQSKPVKIYRLITRNTYERQMFDRASMKLGLDKAVLCSMNTDQQKEANANKQAESESGPVLEVQDTTDDKDAAVTEKEEVQTIQSAVPSGQTSNQPPMTPSQMSKKEIEDLLKRGAYGAVMDDDNSADKFCEEDIEEILQRRTQTLTVDGESGGGFSKASFASADTVADIDIDDVDFWAKWAKKAELDVEAMERAADAQNGPASLIVADTERRSRKKIERFDISLNGSEAARLEFCLNKYGSSKSGRSSGSSKRSKSSKVKISMGGSSGACGDDSSTGDTDSSVGGAASDDNDTGTEDDRLLKIRGIRAKKGGKGSTATSAGVSGGRRRRYPTDSGHEFGPDGCVSGPGGAGGADSDGGCVDGDDIDFDDISLASVSEMPTEPVPYGEWTKADLYKTEKGLLAFGWGQWNEIRVSFGMTAGFSADMVRDVARVIVIYCVAAFRGDNSIRKFVADLISPDLDADLVAGACRLLVSHRIGFSNPVPRGGRKRTSAKLASTCALDDDEEDVDSELHSVHDTSLGTPPEPTSRTTTTYQMKTAKFMNSAAAKAAATYDVIQHVLADSVQWAASDVYNAHQILDKTYQRHLIRHCNKVVLRIRLLFYIKYEMLGSHMDEVNDKSVHVKDIPFAVVPCDIAPSILWNEDLDKSLLVGTLRFGFERYSRMRRDPHLSFATYFGPVSRPDQSAGVESSCVNFPTAPELNGRLRRLVSIFQREHMRQLVREAGEAKRLKRAVSGGGGSSSSGIGIHLDGSRSVLTRQLRSSSQENVVEQLESQHLSDSTVIRTDEDMMGSNATEVVVLAPTRAREVCPEEIAARQAKAVVNVRKFVHTIITFGLSFHLKAESKVAKDEAEEKEDVSVVHVANKCLTIFTPPSNVRDFDISWTEFKRHSSLDVDDGVLFEYLDSFVVCLSASLPPQPCDDGVTSEKDSGQSKAGDEVSTVDTFDDMIRRMHAKNSSSAQSEEDVPSVMKQVLEDLDWRQADVVRHIRQLVTVLTVNRCCHQQQLVTGKPTSVSDLPATWWTDDHDQHLMKCASTYGIDRCNIRYPVVDDESNLFTDLLSALPKDEVSESKLVENVASGEPNEKESSTDAEPASVQKSPSTPDPPSPETQRAIDTALADDSRSRRQTTKYASTATRLAMEAAQIAALTAKRNKCSESANVTSGDKNGLQAEKETSTDNIAEGNAISDEANSSTWDVAKLKTDLAECQIALSSNLVDLSSVDDKTIKTWTEIVRFPSDGDLLRRLIWLYSPAYSAETIDQVADGGAVDKVQTLVAANRKSLTLAVADADRATELLTAVTTNVSKAMPSVTSSVTSQTDVAPSLTGASGCKSAVVGCGGGGRKRKRLNDIMLDLGAKVKMSQNGGGGPGGVSSVGVGTAQNCTSNRAVADGERCVTRTAEAYPHSLYEGAVDEKVQKWLTDHMGVVPDRPNSPVSSNRLMSPKIVNCDTVVKKEKVGSGGQCDSLMEWLFSLPPDQHVSVVNRVTGAKLRGDDAPKLKDLTNWLIDNANFEVEREWAEEMREMQTAAGRGEVRAGGPPPPTSALNSSSAAVLANKPVNNRPFHLSTLFNSNSANASATAIGAGVNNGKSTPGLMNSMQDLMKMSPSELASLVSSLDPQMLAQFGLSPSVLSGLTGSSTLGMLSSKGTTDLIPPSSSSPLSSMSAAAAASTSNTTVSPSNQTITSLQQQLKTMFGVQLDSKTLTSLLSTDPRQLASLLSSDPKLTDSLLKVDSKRVSSLLAMDPKELAAILSKNPKELNGLLGNLSGVIGQSPSATSVLNAMLPTTIGQQQSSSHFGTTSKGSPNITQPVSLASSNVPAAGSKSLDAMHQEILTLLQKNPDAKLSHDIIAGLAMIDPAFASIMQNTMSSGPTGSLSSADALSVLNVSGSREQLAKKSPKPSPSPRPNSCGGQSRGNSRRASPSLTPGPASAGLQESMCIAPSSGKGKSSSSSRGPSRSATPSNSTANQLTLPTPGPGSSRQKSLFGGSLSAAIDPYSMLTGSKSASTAAPGSPESLNMQLLNMIAMMDAKTLHQHQKDPSSPLYPFLSDPNLLKQILSVPGIGLPPLTPSSSPLHVNIATPGKQGVAEIATHLPPAVVKGQTLSVSDVSAKASTSATPKYNTSMSLCSSDSGVRSMPAPISSPTSSGGGSHKNAFEALLGPLAAGLPDISKLPPDLRKALDQLLTTDFTKMDSRTTEMLAMMSGLDQNLMQAIGLPSTNMAGSATSVKPALSLSCTDSTSDRRAPINVNSSPSAHHIVTSSTKLPISSVSRNAPDDVQSRINAEVSRLLGSSSAKLPANMIGDMSLLQNMDLSWLKTVDPKILSSLGLDNMLGLNVDIGAKSGLAMRHGVATAPASSAATASANPPELSSVKLPTASGTNFGNKSAPLDMMKMLDPNIMASLNPKMFGCSDSKQLMDLLTSQFGGVSPSASVAGAGATIMPPISGVVSSNVAHAPTLRTVSNSGDSASASSNYVTVSAPSGGQSSAANSDGGFDFAKIASLDPNLAKLFDPALLSNPALMRTVQSMTSNLDLTAIANMDPRTLSEMYAKTFGSSSHMASLLPSAMDGSRTKSKTGTSTKVNKVPKGRAEKTQQMSPSTTSTKATLSLAAPSTSTSGGQQSAILPALDASLLGALDAKMLASLDPTTLMSLSDPKVLAQVLQAPMPALPATTLAGAHVVTQQKPKPGTVAAALADKKAAQLKEIKLDDVASMSGTAAHSNANHAVDVPNLSDGDVQSQLVPGLPKGGLTSEERVMLREKKRQRLSMQNQTSTEPTANSNASTESVTIGEVCPAQGVAEVARDSSPDETGDEPGGEPGSEPGGCGLLDLSKKSASDQPEAEPPSSVDESNDENVVEPINVDQTQNSAQPATDGDQEEMTREDKSCEDHAEPSE